MVQAKEEPTLSRTEWAIVRRALGRIRHVFVDVSSAEGRLFHTIWGLTVHTNRYVTNVRAEQLRSGSITPELFFPPVGVRATFYRARTALTTRGLIYWQDRDHMINLAGMLQTLELLGSTYRTDWWEKLRKVQDTINQHMVAIELDGGASALPLEGGMDKLEGQIEGGRAKGQKSKERKRLQRESVFTLKPNMVRPFLRDACRDLGVPYIETGPEGRLVKSIQNWLALCHRNEVDPRVRLRQVARWWNAFRANRIQKEDGKYLVLNEAVSFFDYFNYKQLIDGFLVANLQELEDSATEYAEEDWKPM